MRCGKWQLHKKLDRRQVGIDFKMLRVSMPLINKGNVCMLIELTMKPESCFDKYFQTFQEHCDALAAAFPGR